MSVFLLTWWIISDFQNWGSSLAFWDIRWPIVNSGFYFICAGRASIASANHRCLKKVLNSNSKRVLLVRKNRVQTNLWKIVFILPFINSYLSLQFKYMIFHTFICILRLLGVYYKLTMWPALRWLDSLVGRVLHRYRRGHGFEFRSGLNFIQDLISQLLKLCVQLWG